MTNSGEVTHNRVARYIMPGLLAASAILGACSSESSQPAENFPMGVETTLYPGQEVDNASTVVIGAAPIESTTTIVVTPTDTCADNNPILGNFSESNEAVAESLDTLFEQYFDENTGTEEEALAAVQALTETYGFTLTLPHESRVGSGFDYGAVTGDITVFLNDKMRELATALSYFSPELIKKIGLTEMALVNQITRTPGYDDGGSVVDAAAGVFIGDSNIIYVDIGSMWNIEDVVVHEVIHAIDSKILCGDDMFIDDALTKYNTIPYTGFGEELDKVDPLLAIPTADRMYFRTYGAANVAEDRATILEETIMRRGLILEGDPDWGSPLQLKQAELVRRLEGVTPGFGNYMLKRTIFLRNSSNNELNDFIPNPYEDGELSSVSDIIENAYKNNLPVEQLRGVVLTESIPGGEGNSLIVENPIIIRDEGGEVRAVAWANEYYFSAVFYDKYRMTFRAVDEASVSDSKGAVTIVKDGNISDYFFPKEIFVDGVSAEELLINGDYPSPGYIESHWPTLIDPKAFST